MQMYDKGRSLARSHGFTVTKLVYRQRKHTDAIARLLAAAATCPSIRLSLLPPARPSVCLSVPQDDGRDVPVSALTTSSHDASSSIECAITDAFAQTLGALVARGG